jgi:HEAT repeat protein
MSAINPAVVQWIEQLADADQAVAFYAYQCLQDEVFQAGRPGQRDAQAALARILGQELVADAKTAVANGPASFRNNAFLAAAATGERAPLHPARVRTKLARLLGYIPHPEAAPYLAKALTDLEARDTARQALECHRSEQAVDALIAALDSAGAEFCCGVVNSLAKLRGEKAAAALRKAAEDRQDEVRIAAIYALAEFPEPTHDAIIARSLQPGSPQERKAAHIARVRLAATLRASGNRSAAERIYRAILDSDAPEPQKRASRLALG